VPLPEVSTCFVIGVDVCPGPQYTVTSSCGQSVTVPVTVIESGLQLLDVVPVTPVIVIEQAMPHPTRS